jgi:hypothetical protein
LEEDLCISGGGSASGSMVVSSAHILAMGLVLAIYISPAYSDLDVGAPMPIAFASVRPVGGGHPFPSVSKASSGLLELGVVWKSARAG